MGKCGPLEVELFDGRFIPVDPTTAERLDHFLGRLPEGAVNDANQMCLCITDARNGILDMPNERWRSHFSKMLGPLLHQSDLQLSVGLKSVTLYQEKYMQVAKTRKRA